MKNQRYNRILIKYTSTKYKCQYIKCNSVNYKLNFESIRK